MVGCSKWLLFGQVAIAVDHAFNIGMQLNQVLLQSRSQRASHTVTWAV